MHRASLRFVWLVLLVWAVLPPFASAQGGGNRAGLVVRYPDGRIETRCVAFSEPAISGQELLERSGLQPVFDVNGGLGTAVCSVAGSGCSYPQQDCFCRCTGSSCEYWAYYHWEDSGWRYATMGAAGYEVRDGALEGWSWGPGNFSSGTEPPVMAFDRVCSEANLAAAPASSGGATIPVQAGSYGTAALFAAALVAAGGWLFLRGRRGR